MATQAPSERQIVMLSLDHYEFFDDMYQSLLLKLGTLGNLRRVNTAETALRMLSSSSTQQAPAVILLTDAGLSQPRYAPVWDAVVRYARGGGTVIAMGLCSGFIKPDDFTPFFSKAGLGWTYDAYHRTTVKLNRKAKDFGALPEGMARGYSQKAVFAGNVAFEDAWYVTTSGGSRVQSRVLPAENAHRVGTSPCAFARVGKGRLGYLGDVNAERETDAAILAMCQLAF